MKTNIRSVSLVFSVTLLAIGCGAPGPLQDGSVDDGNGAGTTDDKSDDIGSTAQAVYSGWTAYTSEEYAPIVCDSGGLVNSVQCSGSYCDNTRFYCRPSGGNPSSSYWTSHFSEESTNYRYCNAGYWLTGLSCSGSYCDNNSIQCTYMTGISANNCYWTGWISEEGGGFLAFGANYYARGMQCNGSHCDNKRFYVCLP